MPTFTYEAMNNVGQPVKGEVEATSSEEAIAKVRAQGNFPTKIKEKAAKGKKGKGAAQSGGSKATTAAEAGREAAAQQSSGGPSKQRKVGRVPTKLLTQFTRQLSTLIDAGLPILRSLRILEEQQKPGMLRVAIRLVADDVEGGSTLSEAMEKHPKAFNNLYTKMVRAGELGGVLDVILQRLADFMEASIALKRKVIGALVYPVAVITFAFMIVLGLMKFVIPKFAKIFNDMGTGLPKITEMLLDLSGWISDYGWLVLLSIPVGIFLLVQLVKMSPSGKYMVDKIKISIPLFGAIISKTAVARFTRTLGTLLAAGVPILEAINITRETSGNEVYSQALLRVHDGIREGESFAQPLRQAKIVDPMVVNMIDVGEETGELDRMLDKVADTYDDEVDNLVSSMTSLLEPVLIIFLGIIIGFIVLALFMPMVHMISSMGAS